MMKSVAALALLVGATATASAPVGGKILFLADSHGVGPFGAVMDEELRQIPGYTVETYAIGGSAPNWFNYGTFSKCGYAGKADNSHPPAPRKCTPMHAPLLKDLLKGMDRQTVVVALGSNLIGDPLGSKYVRASFENMVIAIQHSGARCVWIGPPRMRRFGAKVDALFESMVPTMRGDSRYPPCQLHDSREYTSYPATGGDGVHYNFKAAIPIAQNWGKTMANKVRTALISPQY